MNEAKLWGYKWGFPFSIEKPVDSSLSRTNIEEEIFIYMAEILRV